MSRDNSYDNDMSPPMIRRYFEGVQAANNKGSSREAGLPVEDKYRVKEPKSLGNSNIIIEEVVETEKETTFKNCFHSDDVKVYLTWLVLTLFTALFIFVKVLIFDDNVVEIWTNAKPERDLVKSNIKLTGPGYINKNMLYRPPEYVDTEP